MLFRESRQGLQVVGAAVLTLPPWALEGFVIELMGSLSLDGKDDTFIFINLERNLAYLLNMMVVGKTKQKPLQKLRHLSLYRQWKLLISNVKLLTSVLGGQLCQDRGPATRGRAAGEGTGDPEASRLGWHPPVPRARAACAGSSVLFSWRDY